MPTERAILAKLTAADLQEYVNYYELEVADRRVKAQLIDALAECEEARIEEMLIDYKMVGLRALCRAFSITPSGRSKAGLIALLVDTTEEQHDNGGRSTQTRPAKAPTRKEQGKAAAGAGGNGATTGYETELWEMADKLRGSMDAAEYKHVVLGLIFLKYISDAFEEHYGVLDGQRDDGVDPEDRDEYTADNVFWVPKAGRWTHLKVQARQPTIGTTVDDAMTVIERENPSLKGVLPKDYARQGLDKQRLGQLIDLVSNIQVGDADSRSRDVLGRIYEYFLSQFASAEGKKGGGVLHATLCGQAPRRNAPTLPRVVRHFVPLEPHGI